MKLKLFLTLLILLIFVGKVGAVDGVADDALTVDSVNSSADSDTGNSLSWTAIPGESLNDVARAFYPNSKGMQRLFIAKTLQLNPEIEPKLKSSMVFETPTLLTIPTLKSLSKSRQAANTSHRAKAVSQDLSMSYSMETSASSLPALLIQEYELLLSKNDFLKAELERLHARINVLQTKLGHLKLMLDKTLSLPDKQAGTTGLTPNSNLPEVQEVAGTLPAKKSFKNLNGNNANGNSVSSVNTVAKQVKPLTQQSPASAVLATEKVEESSSNLLKYGLLAALGLAALLALGAYLLKQYRQRVLVRFSESVPIMDDTLTDLGGQWQDTEQEAEAEYVAEQQPQVSTKNFMNTQMRDEQAKATSTLEEAKLLMSINRPQDAIDHLKLIIEAQPKTSINHWLYLLEIFRTLGLKEEFERYAQSLHRTFNVMTPVWYETSAEIVVPQDLEEFPHIMDKLDAVWPSDLAKVYLESLITDNRDGDRAGFSKAVLDDILMLIALLDTRKAFD
ncbi:MAG: hypothetical protein V4552_04270 [Pseudomonadota bacterium]